MMGEHAPRRALTQADVERLRASPSADNRADTAAKVAAEFGSGVLGGHERRLAEDIFRIMVRDAEVAVREALSLNLCRCDHLSRDIARAMAADVESVARPVIRFSNVLTDEDLIEIVRTDDTEKQKAVARREAVSAPVSTALVATSKEEVVSVLVGNEGAEIAVGSLEKVVEEFGGRPGVSEPLALRRKLPLAVAERLVGLVSERLQEHLISHHDLPQETVAEVILNTRAKATLDLLDAESGGRDVHGLVSLLYHRERLTPTLILRSLCLGDIAFFEASVAVLARVGIANARRLIHDKGQLGLKAVLEQALLPKELFPAFIAAVQVSHETGYDGGEDDRARFKQRMIERILTTFDEPGDGLGNAEIDYLLGKLARIDPEMARMA